jgi:hypothetical protein
MVPPPPSSEVVCWTTSFIIFSLQATEAVRFTPHEIIFATATVYYIAWERWQVWLTKEYKEYLIELARFQRQWARMLRRMESQQAFDQQRADSHGWQMERIMSRYETKMIGRMGVRGMPILLRSTLHHTALRGREMLGGERVLDRSLKFWDVD